MLLLVLLLLIVSYHPLLSGSGLILLAMSTDCTAVCRGLMLRGCCCVNAHVLVAYARCTRRRGHNGQHACDSVHLGGLTHNDAPEYGCGESSTGIHAYHLTRSSFRPIYR